MSDVMVRSATYADEADLVGIDVRTWSSLHAVQPPPDPGKPFYDERHTPEEILVAQVDGRVAGYVRIVPPTPLPCNAHVRQIQGLAVDTWARGRGIARRLMAAALHEAGRQGATRMTLRVLGHNAPARRLYESMGFAVEGVLPGEFLLEGAYVDDVLMGRPLDFAAA
ncbi:GNAT family N-acetyltransferase [Streptomyces sp. SID13666]|uniref:GNAT family N-acetyltransferase n=1 Tax=Streptomyces TaxID=1883 RepID=UPI001107564A|nr:MULTISPECIES: GNAT family N-acetyltransferase [Streptomyces]MCZ4097745.1 GNAT family N-acetyltransferase [Streptomyces sp. H39-C1]NEA59537.1 GNAT family N-acetyltransferase [Streptomyces sp. SID13666]NEA70622.1 GNAT family N-acetyltransferase [Streptomyces sp. SID13588]QNA72997.1 GNAT family N-acetyltransferase [Streptomyces sp. So13.3]